MVLTWRSVVFPVMGRPVPTVEGTRSQAKAIERFGASLGPKRMLEISLLDDEFPLPSAEVRAALEEMSPVVSGYYAAVASVFEGAGFRAALLRGVLSTLQLVSRADFPQKVFSTPDEAADWIAPHAATIGMRLRAPDELFEAVRAVRAIAIERGVFGPSGS